ncbi:hypothetical protein Syun_018785 [Stephania yunnanensis]|uniref:Uncharacterized protein n=1 Tax=Stephania yunnanensis TaxID=152371 RepID=A0AAP0ISW8_9MAGN
MRGGKDGSGWDEKSSLSGAQNEGRFYIKGLTSFTTPKPSFWLQRFSSSGPNSSNCVKFIPDNLQSSGLNFRAKFKPFAYVGRNNRELRFEEDGFDSEPLWIFLAKETFGGLRALVMFLVEQPGQLKYIEWPPFYSTLKTASLTLVLVAMLMVALLSVDATLSYLLAFLLRKSA